MKSRTFKELTRRISRSLAKAEKAATQIAEETDLPDARAVALFAAHARQHSGSMLHMATRSHTPKTPANRKES